MRWVLLGLLAGCDPVYSLTVKVTNPDGVGLVDASLAATNCPAAGDDQAALTDAHGVAAISGLGFTFPPCDLTIAHTGFQPYASSFDELCGGTVEDCDRVQSIDVVLEPNPIGRR